MTKEDIIRMAREAGFNVGTAPQIERFAALVAEHERNACAKVVEGYCGAWDDKGYALAAAIRARS